VSDPTPAVPHLATLLRAADRNPSYYIVGRIGNKRGRWTWGQYTPMIPSDDFELLLEQARAEGTILL
jgi:hypothetical protein